MVAMSRGYVYVLVCWCDRVGQIGESGSLGREGWGEGRGFELYWPHVGFLGPINLVAQ
jgi:hypothetical protein